MSMKIDMNSVTPQQVYNLTLAFQKTRDMGLPQQITTEPTVTVAGRGMGWISPNLTVERAQAVLNEFNRLEAGLFDEGSVDIGEALAKVTGRVTGQSLPPLPEAMRTGKPVIIMPDHLRPDARGLWQVDNEGSAYVEGEDALDPASGDVSNPAVDEPDPRIKPGVTVAYSSEPDEQKSEYEVLRVGGEGLASDVAMIQRGDEESKAVLLVDLEYLHEPDERADLPSFD